MSVQIELPDQQAAVLQEKQQPKDSLCKTGSGNWPTRPQIRIN